jgi:hypothetical protein
MGFWAYHQQATQEEEGPARLHFLVGEHDGVSVSF